MNKNETPVSSVSPRVLSLSLVTPKSPYLPTHLTSYSFSSPLCLEKKERKSKQTKKGTIKN